MSQEPQNPELYKRKFGDSVGYHYFVCHREWLTLKTVWYDWKKLYGTNNETVELLHRTSGNFFHRLDKVYFEWCLMALRRLTDPSKNASNKNISVNSLVEEIKKNGLPNTEKDEQFFSEINEKARHATNACKFARKWTDKNIAHLDLKQERITACRRDFETALSAIYSVFELLERTECNTQLIEEPAYNLGVRGLLFHLFEGELGKPKRQEEFFSKKSNWSQDLYPHWLYSKPSTDN